MPVIDIVGVQDSNGRIIFRGMRGWEQRSWLDSDRAGLNSEQLGCPSIV